MSATMQSPTVDIHDVAIDHVNVSEPKKNDSAQTLVALTPLLTVLITAIGIVFSFCFQMVQNHTAARQKVDSDWRAALEKSTGAEGKSGFVAFEMESFAMDPVYGKDAKSITAGMLPTIQSKFEFDTAFLGLLDHTLEKDQDQVVSVARTLSQELMAMHDVAVKEMHDGMGPADTSAANFVLRPELFLPEDSPKLTEAQSAAWKLDTVSGGLASLWRGTKTGKEPVKPGNVDLTGVIFLNNDFRGIDLREAGMGDTLFLGDCKVDQSQLAKDAPKVGCK